LFKIFYKKFSKVKFRKKYALTKDEKDLNVFLTILNKKAKVLI